MVLSDGTNSVSDLNNNNPPPGSLATNPNITTPKPNCFCAYADAILLLDQNDNNDARGLRSVQDLCPACSGGFGPNAVAHIDMYNATSQSCSAGAVGDYGQRFAIRLRQI
jgi:hypothetical protein